MGVRPSHGSCKVSGGKDVRGGGIVPPAATGTEQPVIEQIRVTAQDTRRTWDGTDSPLGTPLVPAAAPLPPESVAALVQRQPGIAFSGQGGLLQTVPTTEVGNSALLFRNQGLAHNIHEESSQSFKAFKVLDRPRSH